MRRYPSNWPALEPYSLSDTRPDLWPREDNSFVLPLELRPRDKERGPVWMRDTYVNCFVVNGRTVYVATGTTRVPGLDAAAPWNDGIFVWVAPSLKGPWRLADTTGFRPGAEKGKVWSPEFVDENRPGRTVVAPWQEYWYDDEFGKRGQAWASELHHFRGRWYIVACMGDHSRKVGSFMLVSEGGVAGPYRLVEGNLNKPFGDSFIGGPDFIEPGAYHHIDGSLRRAGCRAAGMDRPEGRSPVRPAPEARSRHHRLTPRAAAGPPRTEACHLPSPAAALGWRPQHLGVAVKKFWTVLAVLFAALAVGSVASARESAGNIDDFAVAAVLACLAWASWKSARR